MTLEEQIQKLTAERDAALKALKKYDDELAGTASGATFDFIKRLTAEKDAALKGCAEAEKECERLRLLVPTTAQAMVYQSLLNRFEASEKACAEMREMLDGAEPTHSINSDEEAIAWINKREHAISSDCGKGYVKAESLKCFKCDDGHTPLYCLNCAREGYHHDDEWRPVVEALKTVTSQVCSSDPWRQKVAAETTGLEALAHAEKLTCAKDAPLICPKCGHGSYLKHPHVCH